MRSNLRWCSDVFEIPCWNGDAVRVAFAIDTHDREVLAWTAGPRGIGGIAVRDLMLLAVERRFRALRTRTRWSGWPTTAAASRPTRRSPSRTLGLVPCFTPCAARSPTASPRRS